MAGKKRQFTQKEKGNDGQGEVLPQALRVTPKKCLSYVLHHEITFIREYAVSVLG